MTSIKTHLPLPRAALDQNVIILGKTRAGKSSTMRAIIEHLLLETKPVCLLTPKDDWWGLKLGADGKSAGFPVVAFGGKHADLPINEHAGAQIAELVATGNRPAIITVAELSNRARTKFFIEFAEALFKKIETPIYLGIDECHNFVPKGKMFDPQQAEMLHWGNRLASEGLGMGIMLLSASQRPQKVHNDYLTSHETLIAKRVIHKADRDAIKDWVDGCGDPALGKELIGSVASLDRSEGWVWSPEVGFGPKRVTFPFFSTYDSFKPRAGGVATKLKGWASIDLDAVKAKMGKFVEEAKANDPAELRRQVTQLLAKVKILEAQPMLASATPNPKVIEAAQNAAWSAGWDTGWSQGCSRGFEDGVKKCAADLAALTATTTAKMALFQSYVPPPSGKAQKIAPNMRQVIPGELKIDGMRAKPEMVAPSLMRSTPRGPLPEGISGAQKRVLDAIAFWGSVGTPQPSRAQVAGVAGYSPGSGGFNNLLGGLNTAGLIRIPMAGRIELVEGAPGEALTADQAKQKVMSVLSGAQTKLVMAALERGGEPVSRDQLGEMTGYSPGSGGFNNLIGSLNTLTVFVKPSPGAVALSDWAKEVLI